MVRIVQLPELLEADSPRIRGDGPAVDAIRETIRQFSPYSRGWSPRQRVLLTVARILPVFAGMVPTQFKDVSYK